MKKKMMIFPLVLSAVLIFSANSFAESAADDLLDTLGDKPAAIDKSKAPTSDESTSAAPLRHRRETVDLAKLTDPFQKHMFAKFETADKVPYDVQEWANQILLGHYEASSHLWSVIQNQVPENLQTVAHAAQIYSLYRMGLNQTFFSQWMKALNSTQYSASASETNLEATVGPGLGQWLIDNSIVLNPAQEMTIENLNAKSPVTVTLKAWAALRKGAKAEALLDQLPKNSPLKFYLAETVALDHARKNDLIGVARVLKKHFEPIIESTHDANILTQYYMTIGRLLYQSGKLAAAKEYYEKIPRSSPQFLQAREELAWVLLRMGNTAQLRGEMKTLSLPIFDDTFSPDVFVVRAISNLKMCYFDGVEKDFSKFNGNNSVWAQKIDQAIAAKVAPEPFNPDFYSTLAVNSLQKLIAERAKLEQLGRDSVGAALPAVGIQKHWKEAQDDLAANIEAEKKIEDQEFRRQWKNQKTILSEAIRKMRFIKVEYLTQVRQFSQGTLDKSNLVADAGTTVHGASFKTDEKQIVFPVDGEPWPDELFRLRSSAQAKCVKNNGASK